MYAASHIRGLKTVAVAYPEEQKTPIPPYISIQHNDSHICPIAISLGVHTPPVSSARRFLFIRLSALHSLESTAGSKPAYPIVESRTIALIDGGTCVNPPSEKTIETDLMKMKNAESFKEQCTHLHHLPSTRFSTSSAIPPSKSWNGCLEYSLALIQVILVKGLPSLMTTLPEICSIRVIDSVRSRSDDRRLSQM
ncbi:hypothetical protein ARMGADRAFT_1093362 [Armillaria gallica]|uniref:Uncharacterized protein n=1 Tax=Armillaria gallica TaxID=47427 RepID=A0A2H3CBE3_ARMGA|nr:hypothetical protein ARMGADRAFT_1093362 [Armillaria gallica]